MIGARSPTATLMEVWIASHLDCDRRREYLEDSLSHLSRLGYTVRVSLSGIEDAIVCKDAMVRYRGREPMSQFQHLRALYDDERATTVDATVGRGRKGGRGALKIVFLDDDDVLSPDMARICAEADCGVGVCLRNVDAWDCDAISYDTVAAISIGAARTPAAKPIDRLAGEACRPIKDRRPFGSTFHINVRKGDSPRDRPSGLSGEADRRRNVAVRVFDGFGGAWATLDVLGAWFDGWTYEELAYRQMDVIFLNYIRGMMSNAEADRPSGLSGEADRLSGLSGEAHGGDAPITAYCRRWTDDSGMPAHFWQRRGSLTSTAPLAHLLRVATLTAAACGYNIARYAPIATAV
jgi:hypothetical protein